NAFAHLLIHEFIHANSVGGGGATTDKNILGKNFDEALTETLARAVSTGINQARQRGTKSFDSSVVSAAVRQIKFNTFGACGCLRYQTEVDLIARKITEPERLKVVLDEAYFGGGAGAGDMAGRTKWVKDESKLL